MPHTFNLVDTFELRNLESRIEYSEKLGKVSIVDVVKHRLGAESFEAVGFTDRDIVDSEPINGFVSAAHLAYANHLPLIISPDDLWLTISQGLSKHININAEALRHQFVSHEGQAVIIVRRDEFVRGGTNDWPGVFHEFSDQIANYINKKRDLLVADFTTTGPIEKVVSEITLMEAMKNYFRYEVHTLCGIPRITLLGETKDWENIKQRVIAIAEFDLNWWTDSLLPIVDQFIAASQGKIDTDFWNNFYKQSGGSGGPYINGWINQLFPYIDTWKGNLKNSEIGKDWMKPRCFGGITSEHFPSGLSVAPFVWKYFEDTFSMEFVGGFFGASQDSGGSIRPKMSWVVKYTEENK